MSHLDSFWALIPDCMIRPGLCYNLIKHMTKLLHITFGPVSGPQYFDLANIDHYDVIFGIPFMMHTGIILDLNTHQIHIGSSVFLALKVGEDPHMQHTWVKKLTLTKQSD